MGSILVTGASGFVGQALCRELIRRGVKTRAALRGTTHFGIDGCEQTPIATIDGETDWNAALLGIDSIIHLAARVHVMRDAAADPLSEFRRTNTIGTEHLARSAAAAGVKRLVYVSSIKVNGEETAREHQYTESDTPSPQDPYGVSKWEAEQSLHQISQETGLEVVIIRPPLIYGPGVKGNFIQLMTAVAKGIPLPFGSTRNQRDLIFVGNLVDLLIATVSHPDSAGKTYVVRDGEPISTGELTQRMASALGVSSRTFSFPASLLSLAGQASGRSAQVARLLGSLKIDDGEIRRELNWHPPFSMRQGLEVTADWFKSRKS